MKKVILRLFATENFCRWNLLVSRADEVDWRLCCLMVVNRWLEPSTFVNLKRSVVERKTLVGWRRWQLTTTNRRWMLMVHNIAVHWSREISCEDTGIVVYMWHRQRTSLLGVHHRIGLTTDIKGPLAKESNQSDLSRFLNCVKGTLVECQCSGVLFLWWQIQVCRKSAIIAKKLL